MIDLDVVIPGQTIRIPFNSFAAAGQALTMTNFAAADILVYKDGSTTERASTSGFTATTDFDGKTGKHLAIIDLSDNTTTGFWSAGSEYLVALDSVTVDSLTVGTWLARFRIGRPGAILDTTIATLASQTSFTLTSGPAENNALTGLWALVHAAASAVQWCWVEISAYTGSTKTVTLAAGGSFTIAAGDNFSVMAIAALRPGTVGRTLVVDSAGLADANTVKVGPTGAGTAQTAKDLGVTVNQTGDAYAIVNSGTFGNSALKNLLDAINGLMDTELGDIKAKTDNLPASPAATGDCITAAGVRGAVGLAAANLDTQLGEIPTAAENAAGLLDLTAGVETSRTVRQALRLILAVAAGKVSGASGTTITIRDTNDSVNRVVATVDSDGNRSAVTLDAS